jgi:hypothetical protein
MVNKLNGSCLCGDITYVVEEDFEAFYFCHCSQCQKVTGSAFASNIITSLDNIKWLTGFNKIKNYEDSNRAFSKAFCKNCGAGVPHVNKSKTSLVIPAGSLLDQPSISPSANLFRPESPVWLEPGLSAVNFKDFPE